MHKIRKMETRDLEKEVQLKRHDGNLQMMPIEQAKEWYNQFAEFTQSILKKDMDYGVIPGTPKPALLKAGAEKLRLVYSLGVEFEMTDKTVDLDKPFVDYTYQCTIRSKQGQVLSQCDGSCNSLEAKFGYSWLPVAEISKGTDTAPLRHRTFGKKMQEFDFAVSKAETAGQYGKPAAYWNMWKEAIKNNTARKITKTSKSGKEMDAWELDETITQYRVPNPEVIGLKNTIMKMAQKRAFVGAVLIATGASEFFTQDIEDMVVNGKIYSDENHTEVIAGDEIVVNEPEIVPVPEIVKDGLTHTSLKQWQIELDKCITKREMLALYTRNKAVVDLSPVIQRMFTSKRNELSSSTTDKVAA